MPLDTSKSLKQGRLPFSPVDAKSKKKRKNSSESETEKSSKLLKPDDSLSKKTAKDESPKNDVNEGKRVEDQKEIKSVAEEKENIRSSKSNVSKTKELSDSENDKNTSEVCEIVLDNTSDDEKVADNENEERQKSKKSVKRKRISKRKTSSGKMNSSLQDMFKKMEVKKDKRDSLKEGNSSSHIIEIDNSDNEETPKNEAEEDEECSEELSKNEKSMDESEISDEALNNSNSKSLESDASEEETSKNKDSTGKGSPLQRKGSMKKNKFTPRQRQKEEEIKKKQEQKLKEKIEKEKLKKEKEAEKLKEREERKRKLNEIKEAREKEKEEKRIKREEERLKKEEKKEEEKQKKMEEKMRKEEEKLQAEEEEREKQAKLKAKFAQFFVAKKSESTPPQAMEAPQGNFICFQVKDNMKMAPLVRSSLSGERRKNLDETLGNEEQKESLPSNYLEEIKNKAFVGRSSKTFPFVEKSEYDDDCEILDEEDEDIDGTNMFEEIKPTQMKSKVRAKFFQFCENNRPPYYGTWSKKPKNLNGRKPFTKEEVFDYEYDSDEDWEEIENGESLSDSDGEGDEAVDEEANQYEVDNEFFVPHGYLSDGEGEDDDDDEGINNVGGDNQEKEKDETLQKEKLKQKQEEFELELKQKTKQLKPKVFGCVWLGDKSSHKAYDQLLNLLTPHRAIVMFGNCPINLDSKDSNYDDAKDVEEEEEESSKRFVKSFPEKAVPYLIKLIHGNQNSKLFLTREFNEFWKKKHIELEKDSSNSSGCIALRKIEPKIQEIGQYGKFSEDGITPRCRVWYVSKEMRSKYGLEDLTLENTWNYTLSLKSKRNSVKETEEVEEENGLKAQSRSPSTNLITKFTKVFNGEESKRKLVSPSRLSESGTPSKIINKSSEIVTPVSTKGKTRKRNSITPLSKEKDQFESPKPSKSIASFFKNIEKSKSETSEKPGKSDSVIVID